MDETAPTDFVVAPPGQTKTSTHLMFLLDTNVVSELRKPKPHGGVVAWVSAQEAKSLFISAITIAELQRGIEMTRKRDTEKALQIESWLEQLLFTGQVLALDAAAMLDSASAGMSATPS